MSLLESLLKIKNHICHIVFTVGGIDIRISIHTTSIFRSHRIVAMAGPVADIRTGRQFQPEHIFYKIEISECCCQKTLGLCLILNVEIRQRMIEQCLLRIFHPFAGRRVSFRLHCRTIT